MRARVAAAYAALSGWAAIFAVLFGAVGFVTGDGAKLALGIAFAVVTLTFARRGRRQL